MWTTHWNSGSEVRQHTSSSIDHCELASASLGGIQQAALVVSQFTCVYIDLHVFITGNLPLPSGVFMPVPHPALPPGKADSSFLTSESSAPQSPDGIDFVLESTPNYGPVEPTENPPPSTGSGPAPNDPKTVVLLDPGLIRPSSVPNRHPSFFDDQAFQTLEQSIVFSGGNLVPISVRPIPMDASGHQFEIISGERRHRVCRKIGQPVRAIVETPQDDQASFLMTFRENQGRADLSAWEVGCQIKFGLEHGHFSSRLHASREIGRDTGDVSRAVQLASLPPDVVSAFASPRELTYRHAKPLTDAVAVADSCEAVLEEARRIRNAAEGLGPGEVLKRLLAAAAQAKRLLDGGVGEPIGQSNGKVDIAIEQDGQPVGRLVSDAKGILKITLEQPLDEKQRGQLIEQLQAFYKRCVLKTPRQAVTKVGVAR